MHADIPEFVRDLVAAGMPVFVARASPHSPLGFALPTGWERSTPGGPGALEAWEPGDALCGVTGVALDVIDVDRQNGGEETYQELRSYCSDAPPRVYARVNTPSGGFHLYVARLDIRKTKYRGVDVQAGDRDGGGRGFVFLPPTRRLSKTTGELAQYVVDANAMETFGADDDSGAMFLRWLALVRGSIGAGPGRAGAVGESIEQGEHDDTLSAYTLTALRRHGGDLRLTLADVQDRALDCKPPWMGGPASIAREFSTRWFPGAWRKAIGSGWVPDNPRPPDPIVLATEGEEELIGHLAAVDWATLWADQTLEEWILEPLIGAGAQTVIYSAPKVGKSLLALEVAAGLARGAESVLGVSLARPYSVLYVDHENRLRADVRKRLQDMGLGPADLERLHLYSFPRMAKLDTSQGGVQILALAQRHGVDLVIIDTVSRAIAGEENSNDTWLRFYSHTGQLLKAAGIALLRLDHTGKDTERGQRGGSAKSGDVDLVWHLEEVVSGEVFVLRCDASRMENTERIITLNRRSDPLRHDVDALGICGALDSRDVKLISLLDSTGAPADITVVAATEWLRERGHQVRNGSVSKRLLGVRKARAALPGEIPPP